MTISEMIDTLISARDAYQNAPTARTKKARYQRMLNCCQMLSARLDEATAWMDENMYTTTITDDMWIDVLAKYERGWNALEEAKTWL